MGVWDGDEKIKETTHSELKIGPHGIQGIAGLRGPTGKNGKDSILPHDLLLKTGFTMAGPIDMALNSIKGVKYPTLLNDCCPKSYIDSGRTIIPADNITGSNASFKTSSNE